MRLLLVAYVDVPPHPLAALPTLWRRLSAEYRAFAMVLRDIVATIRGFDSVGAFIAHNRLCTDYAHRPLYAGQCTRRWMDLRLELVNALSITCVADR